MQERMNCPLITKLSCLLIAGALIVSVVLSFSEAQARWGSINGGNPYCTRCHSIADANAFLYTAINGTEMATPSVNITTAGGTFEIDWFYTNIADTAKSVGTQILLPAATWSLNPGTNNTQTGANFAANWNENWEQAAGVASWNQTRAGQLYYSLRYEGTPFDKDPGSATLDTALDNGSEPDATANFMGTDAVITVPAGLTQGSSFTVTVFGIGHDVGTRAYVSKDITVNIISAGNNPPDTPANPSQYQSDGTTTISVGGFATSTTVVFDGDLSDTDGDTVKLQIDYTGDSSFDCESALVASGSTNVQVSCAGLIDGNSYDWQYQAVDSNGAVSGWTAFNGTSPDFTVDATAPVTSSTVPTNGATGVALNAQVTINWDESIDCTTVNTISITSDSPTWTLNSCSGSTVTFNTGGQANSTTYNVNVTTAITDLAGNPMSAVYPFSYTTVALGGSAPTVSTTTVYWTQTNVISSVKDITAKLGATIDSDGAASITERGIVWSATDNTPTIGEPGVTKVDEGGTAVGIFSTNVSGLTKATLTYFRGYATNSQGTGYSTVSTFYTEPDIAAAPTVDAPTGTNYFELTVNYLKPANADGILVVARPTYAPNTAPYDGRVYTANSRVGAGDTTEPGCIIFCEYVVADDTASGSVTVTGLKDNLNHYFAVYAYTGSGAGISGINYVQTISATGPIITDTVPAAGKSHNELYVAQGGAGGTMTSADCANCHGAHHTSQLLPTGIDMYNKCFVCHQAGGAADSKINIGMHLADGSVDCGTCHSMHSFREEELYSTNHSSTRAFNRSFVRSNMKKHFNTTNGFPVDALEPTVFQNRPSDFAFQSTDPPYNAVCQTCHSDDAKTSHHQQDATDDHQFGNDCISCHAHKSSDEYNAFEPSAGHPVDFGKDAACTVCHTGAKVLEDIHGNGSNATCTLCHAGSPNRDNEKLGDKGLGDARNADGTAAAGTWASQTCLTCHDVTDPDINPPIASVGEMHHGHANATGGNCVSCHMPKVGTQSPLANRNDIMMPANLACNFCHLWWPNNIDYINQGTDNGYNTTVTPGKIMIYRLTFDPVTNQRQMATIAPITSHAISTNATTPINDYGACFACHGATGVDNGRVDAVGQADMIRPFHGLGQPVTAAVAVNASGSNADFNRHVNNFFAGPQQTASSAAVKTVPYNPGYAAFNFLALDVGTNQGGGTKPYSTDDNTYKFIHNSERSIRGVACRNTAIGNTTSSIEYNNWGPDLAGVGSITVNTGGVEGATTKNTVMPLVNISLPTSVSPQAGCP